MKNKKKLLYLVDKRMKIMINQLGLKGQPNSQILLQATIRRRARIKR
jgi:hypothetical protein